MVVGKVETATVNLKVDNNSNEYIIMKKTILFLLCALLGVQSNYAGNNGNNSEIKNASIAFSQRAGDNTTSILFEYDEFKDLETFDFGILDDVMTTSAEDCEVTATVTVSATFMIGGNVGVASSGQQSTITVSANVTASCGEIDSAVRSVISKLKTLLGL